MIELATMQDWWRLIRRYPEYRRTQWSPLREHGYMRLFDAVQPMPRSRILEFGHGLHCAFLERFQFQHEVFGLDDLRERPGSPLPDEYNDRYANAFANRCGRASLRRGLLGVGSRLDAELRLEPGTFDAVASVSVLDAGESEAEHDAILADIAALLRPGGRVFASVRFTLPDTSPVDRLVRGLASHHLQLVRPQDAPLRINLAEQFNELLLDHPTVVMHEQHQTAPTDQPFQGHRAAAWIEARKPA